MDKYLGTMASAAGTPAGRQAGHTKNWNAHMVDLFFRDLCEQKPALVDRGLLPVTDTPGLFCLLPPWRFRPERPRISAPTRL